MQLKGLCWKALIQSQILVEFNSEKQAVRSAWKKQTCYQPLLITRSFWNINRKPCSTCFGNSKAKQKMLAGKLGVQTGKSNVLWRNQMQQIMSSPNLGQGSTIGPSSSCHARAVRHCATVGNTWHQCRGWGQPALGLSTGRTLEKSSCQVVGKQGQNWAGRRQNEGRVEQEEDCTQGGGDGGSCCC